MWPCLFVATAVPTVIGVILPARALPDALAWFQVVLTGVVLPAHVLYLMY